VNVQRMADGRSLTTISEADYEAIESAVMETDRGRWFLKEYTRRNRNADTQVLLDAIGRLEQAVAGERVAQEMDRLRANLKEMATAIDRTKADIASAHAVEQEHSRLFEASEALDAITRTTELATSDILAAAENIQESAWTLREGGADPQLCDELDRRATEIYTACSFQDITAQRIAKIIQTLRYLEGRINAMIAIWDKTEASFAPAEAETAVPPSRSQEPEPIDLDQNDIDSMIVGEDPFGGPDEPADVIEAEPPQADEVQAETWQAASQTEPAEAEPLRAEALQAEPERNRPPLLVGDLEPDDLTFDETEPPAPAPVEPRLRIEAFAEIDRMPTREKLRAFT
jgi:hypothetical protein